MPRRPGESRGGIEKTEETHNPGAEPGPPVLAAVHFHAGRPEAAPLHPELKSLLALWTGKRGKHAAPNRRDIPVFALKRWSAQIAILEPAAGTFRFRLSGAGLRARFGREMTGLTLHDLPADLRKALTAHLDLASAKQAPVAAATLMARGSIRTLWSEVMLPVSGRPPILILGSVPTP